MPRWRCTGRAARRRSLDDEELGVGKQLPVGQSASGWPPTAAMSSASWVIIGSHSESLGAPASRVRRSSRGPARRSRPSWAATSRVATYAHPAVAGQVTPANARPAAPGRPNSDRRHQRSVPSSGRRCRCPHATRPPQRLPGAPHSRRPAPRTARTWPATAGRTSCRAWRKLARSPRSPHLTVPPLMSPASSRATRRTRRPSSSSEGERCATAVVTISPAQSTRDRLCSGPAMMSQRAASAWQIASAIPGRAGQRDGLRAQPRRGAPRREQVSATESRAAVNARSTVSGGKLRARPRSAARSCSRRATEPRTRRDPANPSAARASSGPSRAAAGRRAARMRPRGGRMPAATNASPCSTSSPARCCASARWRRARTPRVRYHWAASS